jgi:hypothetical protein
LIPGEVRSNLQLVRGSEKELSDLGFGRWLSLAHSHHHGGVEAASTGPFVFLRGSWAQTCLSLFVFVLPADSSQTSTDRIPEAFKCLQV